MNRLQRAAIAAFCLHLIAGIGMILVLWFGLETNPDLQNRLAFLVNHRVLWSAAWLTWTAAALSILYFFTVFAEIHLQGARFALLLTVAAMGPDLAAQAIEIGVLPSLAFRAFSTNAAPELFLTFHRVAVMLSGYLANGLYSLTALLLAWSARRSYPSWVWLAGVVTGLLGIGLSAAVLAESVEGMFWMNALLVPALLIWLAGVGVFSGSFAFPLTKLRQRG